MLNFIDELDLPPLVLQLKVKVSVLLSGSVLAPSSRLDVAVATESSSNSDAGSTSSGDVKAAALKSIEGSLNDHVHTPELEKDTDAVSKKLAFTLTAEEMTVLTTISAADEPSTTTDTDAVAFREVSNTRSDTADEELIAASEDAPVKTGELVDFAFKSTPHAD